jgi:hypothetical protein
MKSNASGTVRVLPKYNYVLKEQAAMVTQVPGPSADLRVSACSFHPVYLPPDKARLDHFFQIIGSLSILM